MNSQSIQHEPLKVRGMEKRPLFSKKSLETLFFLGPWITVFLVFQMFPLAYSFYLAFTNRQAISQEPAKFVGIDNFIALLQNAEFLNALKNSLLFVVGTVPITMALSVLVGFVLNKRLVFRPFYHLAFFAPSITSLFVVANLFAELYSENGFFNKALVYFGIAPIFWLKNVHYALPAIMLMNIWASFGFYALLFLSSMQSFPKEYYEIADLEGFGSFAKLWHVTLPLLMPMVKVASLLNAILAFQVFGEVYVMTRGGPVKTTEVAVFYIFDQAFSEQKLGVASAAAYIVFLMLLGLTLLKNISVPKRKSTVLSAKGV